LLGCFVYYSGLGLFELENAVLQPGKHFCEIQEAGSKPDLLFVEIRAHQVIGNNQQCSINQQNEIIKVHHGGF
jgi:hypothetical protein